jgi:hypothetical protein
MGIGCVQVKEAIAARRIIIPTQGVDLALLDLLGLGSEKYLSN